MCVRWLRETELYMRTVSLCYNFQFKCTHGKQYLQDISQNTNCPHVCVEAHWFPLHNLWCSEFSSSCRDLNNLIGIQLCCQPKVYELHVCTISCLTHDIFRLDICQKIHSFIHSFFLHRCYFLKNKICSYKVMLSLHLIKHYTMKVNSCDKLNNMP